MAEGFQAMGDFLDGSPMGVMAGGVKDAKAGGTEAADCLGRRRASYGDRGRRHGRALPDLQPKWLPGWWGPLASPQKTVPTEILLPIDIKKIRRKIASYGFEGQISLFIINLTASMYQTHGSVIRGIKIKFRIDSEIFQNYGKN
jgi:hypothetical protein